MNIAEKTNEIIAAAKEKGFTNAAPLDISTIELTEQVRDMCAVNKCHAYGTNWSCPPACGTIDECSAVVKSYESGIIVQTTGELEDDFDFETMEETMKKHSQNFIGFIKYLRATYPELDILPLGAGACMSCGKCTYPDAPCRFPELKSSPMEGYGMVISEVCKANNIDYYYGKGTLTYVGCYLFKNK
jgi:predicted metal-binding protein